MIGHTIKLTRKLFVLANTLIHLILNHQCQQCVLRHTIPKIHAGKAFVCGFPRLNQIYTNK